MKNVKCDILCATPFHEQKIGFPFALRLIWNVFLIQTFHMSSAAVSNGQYTRLSTGSNVAHQFNLYPNFNLVSNTVITFIGYCLLYKQQTMILIRYENWLMEKKCFLVHYFYIDCYYPFCLVNNFSTCGGSCRRRFMLVKC